MVEQKCKSPNFVSVFPRLQTIFSILYKYLFGVGKIILNIRCSEADCQFWGWGGEGLSDKSDLRATKSTNFNF